MFGLVSGQRVQRRYSLSETTLQQGDFKDMVHRHVFIHEVCNFGQKRKEEQMKIILKNCLTASRNFRSTLYFR